MTKRKLLVGGALAVANALAWAMLGFHQTGAAAPPQNNEPFANAVEQRAEIIGQLKELNGLLKEQNALFKSGKLVVVIGEEK
jgi:hypothetical protein